MKSPAMTFHNPVFDRIPDEKKEMILSIAVEEFANCGFAGTNINRVAEKAGISIGSLYKYFPTKENLYFGVVNHCFKRLSMELTPVLEEKSGLKEKLKTILDLLFDNSERYRSLNRLYNRFTTEGNSEMARSIAEQVEMITARAYADLLHQAQKEGIIDDEIDERAFAFLIDNIFITIQFSLSTEYYEDRMKIYLGKEMSENPEYLKKQAYLFILRALGLE